MTTQLRTFSSGAGVQSIAALVLCARGVLKYPIHLFCNVGDDSEHPETLAYVQDYAQPFAESHGIEWHEIQRIKRDGTTETLYGRLIKDGSKSLPIPVRGNDTGAPGKRSCTADFKIRIIEKWIKSHGASDTTPAITGIGISYDEWQRMRTSKTKFQILEYPLVQAKITRDACERIIIDAGLPVPPKSACYFCPFHTVRAWAELRKTRPDLFQKSSELESLINDRRNKDGKSPVWFSSRMKPLGSAFPEDYQILLFPHEDEHDCGPFVCDTNSSATSQLEMALAGI